MIRSYCGSRDLSVPLPGTKSWKKSCLCEIRTRPLSDSWLVICVPALWLRTKLTRIYLVRYFRTFPVCGASALYFTMQKVHSVQWNDASLNR